MSKTFVIGDIHGAYIPLQQCLERCGFDYENDVLITLGDICDGWPHVYECVEILLKIKNRIDIVGNHDMWFKQWLKTGKHPDNWRQGGMGTLKSYERNIKTTRLKPTDTPESHDNFFLNQRLYFKDHQNRLFVHGGFIRELTLEQNADRPYDDYCFFWNRDLWNEALSVSDGDKLLFVEEFSEIFIGHTETTNWTKFRKAPNSHVLIPMNNTDCPPMKADIIYNLDTGAGSSGKLTIMDLDTHEYWQSDCVNEIYGDYKPRG